MIEGNGQGNSRQGWQSDSELTNRRANSQGSDSAGSDNQAWERIDAVCDRFEARWLDGDEPQIESFLPAERNLERELTFRELLKLDLDYRWRCDVPRLSAADYAAKFPEYREIIEEEIDRVVKTHGGETTYAEANGSERFAVAWLLDSFNRDQRRADRGSLDEESTGKREFPSGWSDLFRTSNQAFFESRFVRRLRIWSQWQAYESQIENGDEAGESAMARRSDAWIREESDHLPREFGEYQLLRVAGHGGMGVVYEAIHQPTGRRVALKLVRRDRLEHRHRDEISLALSRFQQEARAAAGIDHEHWVSVYDVGDMDGQPFYSMQFVDGPSLAALIRQGPIEGERAARYLEPVARALATAHERRILHRDLKPHNILIRRDVDHALITDFGLAKLLDDGNGDTCTGDAFGSPSYVSPEQALDASRVDERSDIYGLGATLYHAITGRPPFQASSIGRVIDQVLHREPIEPRQLNPHIDPDLETICLKCLAKEPRQRFSSAAELAEELRRYLEKRPIRSRPISRWERARRWSQRNPLSAVLGGSVATLLTLLLVGATVAGWMQRDALQQTKQALVQEQQAKAELTEALIEYVELVSSEPLLSEEQFQPLRNQLLQGTSQRLDQFLNEPTRDDHDRTRVSQIWTSIANIEFQSGRLQEARQAVEQGLHVLDQFDHTWSTEVRQSYFDLQLLLAEIEWETGSGEDALERLKQVVTDTSRVPLTEVDQATVQVRAEQLAIDIHLAWAEISLAEQHLASMRKQFQTVPPNASLEYALLASNAYERESLLHRQNQQHDLAIQDAQRAVQAWNLPDTDSFEELSESCQAQFQIDVPPADYFRQLSNWSTSEYRASTSTTILNRSEKVIQLFSSMLKRFGNQLEYRLVYERFRLEWATINYRIVGSKSPIGELSTIAETLSRFRYSSEERASVKLESARIAYELAGLHVMQGHDDRGLRLLEEWLGVLDESEHREDMRFQVVRASIATALAKVLSGKDGKQDSIHLLSNELNILRKWVSRKECPEILVEKYVLLGLAIRSLIERGALPVDRVLSEDEFEAEIGTIVSRFPRLLIARTTKEILEIDRHMRLKHSLTDEALAETMSSLQTLNRIASQSNSVEYQLAYSNSLFNVGQSLMHLPKYRGKSIELLEQSQLAYSNLSERFPHRQGFVERLARNSAMLATLYLTIDRREEARRQFQAADMAYAKLKSRFLDISKWPTSFLGSWMVAVHFQHKLSDESDLALLQRGIAIYDTAGNAGHDLSDLRLAYSSLLLDIESCLSDSVHDQPSLELFVLGELSRMDVVPERRKEFLARRDTVLLRQHVDVLAERRDAYWRDVSEELSQMLAPGWRTLQRRGLQVWADVLAHFNELRNAAFRSVSPSW